MSKMTSREMQREAASYLSRYQVAKAEVKDIERRIERIRSEMMGVKGIDYTCGDMPKQQNRTGDLSDYIVRIDDLIRGWEAARDRAAALMTDVSVAIDAVNHDKARRVLMLHFIDGSTYEEIAEDMQCDIRTVYRWRKIGLKKIVVNCQ